MTTSIEDLIMSLCAARAPEGTICPSEVARALAGAETRWRHLMPAVRAVARELALAGRIVITQKGREIDLHSARGPIRLGLPRRGT